MFRLARFLKAYKKQVILGPVFKLTEAVFELIVPLVMASIVDVGIKNQDTAYVWKMGGVLLLLGAVGLVCALICQYYASIASQGFGTTVRNALFHHINTLSHKEIDQFGTPSLITRLTNDVNQLQYAVAMLIRLVVRAPFLAIGAMVMAMSIDFQLSIVLLVAMPIIVLILYLVMSRSIPFYRVIQKKWTGFPWFPERTFPAYGSFGLSLSRRAKSSGLPRPVRIKRTLPFTWAKSLLCSTPPQRW